MHPANFIKNKENIFFFSILICGLLLVLWGINQPFVGLYNLNNNQLFWGASNYLKFGYLKLHFLPTYFEGNILPNPIPYYLHHPVLIYLIESILLKIFGFGNWVVHLAPLFYSLGSLAFLYKIAEFVWNKKIAILASISAILFPMFNFFWKMSVFEHISLFFMLWVLYIILLYLKKSKTSYLWFIFILSLLAGFSDWGGAYLVLPILVILIFNKTRKKILLPSLAYFFGVGISLLIFIVAVFLAVHNLKELIDAILNRSVSNELFSLSFWPIRLFVITLLRIFLYFSPLAFISIIIFKRKNKLSTNQIIILSIFLILGLENIFALSSASWGHSFLMFYFIPFFAVTSGLFLDKIRNKKVLYLSIILLLVFSFGINYLKNYQIQKQMWKYNAAVWAQNILPSFEEVATNNFPGEVFATYFNNETVQIPFSDIPLWIVDQKNYGVKYLILPCTLACSPGEMEMASLGKKYGKVFVYKEGVNTAFLIERSQTKENLIVTESKSSTSPSSLAPSGKVPLFLSIYRDVRNFISAEQI